MLIYNKLPQKTTQKSVGTNPRFKNVKLMFSYCIQAFIFSCISASASAIMLDNNDPQIPPEYEPPEAPNLMIGRYSNQISLRINDSSLYEDGYTIQKRESNQWITIASSGPLSNNQYLSTVETSLKPDTRYCFRASAYNTMGAQYSPTTCAYTRDGKDHEIWRAQLEIETSPNSGAGTNDLVWVRLNSGSNSEYPRNNLTVLDYPGDDFNRNSTRTYDLNLDGLSEMSDINRIGIYKTGTDDWCVSKIKLIVNNDDVFSRDYTNVDNGCFSINSIWGSNFSYLTIDKSALRNHSEWIGYNETSALLNLANGIFNDELVSRFSSMIGHKNYYNILQWRNESGPLVYVNNACNGSTDCSKLHVELDLEADVSVLDLGNITPNVDISFDVDFICEQGGGLNITTSNFQANAHTSVLSIISTLGLALYIEGELEDGLAEGWENISQSVAGVPECEVSMSQYGDVFLAPTTN